MLRQRLLSILSLTTVPTRFYLQISLAHRLYLRFCCGGFLSIVAQNFVIMRAMSLLTALDPHGIVQLVYSKLETQSEKLCSLRFASSLLSSSTLFFSQFTLPSQLLTTVLFFTNLHLTGSLWEASLRDLSGLCSSWMPPISNITLPGQLPPPSIRANLYRNPFGFRPAFR